MMFAEVQPYFSASSAGFPDSPNESMTPTNSTGTGASCASTSKTADPMPPWIWCSSAVTIAFVLVALSRIVFLSIGLIV